MHVYININVVYMLAINNNRQRRSSSAQQHFTAGKSWHMESGR